MTTGARRRPLRLAVRVLDLPDPPIALAEQCRGLRPPAPARADGAPSTSGSWPGRRPRAPAARNPPAARPGRRPVPAPRRCAGPHPWVGVHCGSRSGDPPTAQASAGPREAIAGPAAPPRSRRPPPGCRPARRSGRPPAGERGRCAPSPLRRARGCRWPKRGRRDGWRARSRAPRVLEVYRDPVPNAAAPYGWRYGTAERLTSTAIAAPLALPSVRIAVRTFRRSPRAVEERLARNSGSCGRSAVTTAPSCSLPAPAERALASPSS